MRKNIVHRQKGYAVVIVMVLLVVGTVMMVLMNRENTFFSRVAGFFNRNQKIQDQASDGVELAKHDLNSLAVNSRSGTAGQDWFTTTDGGSKTEAFNQGLYFDSAGTLGTRTVAPRLTRTNGDLELKVYYFPEDPCLGAQDPSCSTDDAIYNNQMPKLFMVISMATNTKSGEVFTEESMVQLKLRNSAEYSVGVLGVRCLDNPPPAPGAACVKPFPNSKFLDFSPATYGRSYFDIDPADLRFIFDSGADTGDENQQHIFNDVVEFPQGSDTDSARPFQLKKNDIKDTGGTDIGDKLPMMTFKKGYTEGKEVFLEPGDADYDPLNDPSSDEFFAGMESMAEDVGYNLSDGVTCPTGGGSVDVCLKFDNDKIKQYTCNKFNDDIMGRVDYNMHPGDFGSDDADKLMTGPYDRYVGEHAEVYQGVPAGTELGDTNGVVYCHLTGCDCKVHIKGIVQGQVTVAADVAVIEGDLIYSDIAKDSEDTLGVISKKDIIFPMGVPQAATSAPTSDITWQQDIPLADSEPPYTSDPSTTPQMPTTLASSYLGITNFIAQKDGEYVDRDVGSTDYKDFVGWDMSATGVPEMNSPMALDIEGNLFAGRSVVIDGVYNPEMDVASTTDTIESVALVTCENPPTCTTFKYRNPAADASDPNALYKADGSLAESSPGVTVEPYYYVDGLNMTNADIDGQTGKPKYNNFTNTGYQVGEEVARPANKVISIFGGINSKYYYINDQKIADNNEAFKMGFLRKRIVADPRNEFLTPPGYPSTLIIDVYEIYQKSYQGKSDLVP